MIETYDALCLKEPWLMLIMLGYKTLETRTKCLRKRGGEVLLTSSKSIDEQTWALPGIHWIADTHRARALEGLGKLACLATFGDCHPGVPGVDDKAACITIALPNGDTRFVYQVSNIRLVKQVPTVRLRPDGTEAFGASQGFFRVPKHHVVLL